MTQGHSPKASGGTRVHPLPLSPAPQTLITKTRSTTISAGCRILGTRAPDQGELIYGQMTKRFEGLRLRCIGLARAIPQTGLSNLCYNLLRTVFLLPTTPSLGIV